MVHVGLTHGQVPFAEYNLNVPLEPTPFPSDREKRVSINSFGIGGTNAHVSPYPSKPCSYTQHALGHPRVIFSEDG